MSLTTLHATAGLVGFAAAIALLARARSHRTRLAHLVVALAMAAMLSGVHSLAFTAGTALVLFIVAAPSWSGARIGKLRPAGATSPRAVVSPR
jgi:hypothetical protein